MSKPMLVTLPFVMLLLDYWPLKPATSDQWQLSKVMRLALEKWPFFFARVSFVRHKHFLFSLNEVATRSPHSNSFRCIIGFVTHC